MVSTAGVVAILIYCGFDGGLMVILIDSVVRGYGDAIDGGISWLWFRLRD